MNDTLPLTLSSAALDRLYVAANGRGEKAHVDRKELFALLRDHTVTVGKLNDMGVQTK